MLAGLFEDTADTDNAEVRIRFCVRDSPAYGWKRGRRREERCAQKWQGFVNPLELLSTDFVLDRRTIGCP